MFPTRATLGVESVGADDQQVPVYVGEGLFNVLCAWWLTEIKMKLTAIWFIGVVFRWCVLMPWRVSVCLLGIMWMLISMFVGEFK